MPGNLDLSRLSLNQATTMNWGTAETIDGCARAGVSCAFVRREIEMGPAVAFGRAE